MQSSAQQYDPPSNKVSRPRETQMLLKSCSSAQSPAPSQTKVKTLAKVVGEGIGSRGTPLVAETVRFDTHKPFQGYPV